MGNSPLTPQIPASRVLWSRIIPGWWTPMATPSEQVLRVYGSEFQRVTFWNSPTKLSFHLVNFLLSDFLLPHFFPPFSLLPFLNWLWNWSIFLNYLLYLLNKVFNVPVLKFRLSLPLTSLSSHSIIALKISLLGCFFNWSAYFWVPYFFPVSGII